MIASAIVTVPVKVSREDKKKTKALWMEQNECSICIDQMNKSTKKKYIVDRVITMHVVYAINNIC